MNKEEARELLNTILKASYENMASDVYIKAGNPPFLRINNVMCPVECDPWTPETIEELAIDIMPARLRQDFISTRPESNFCYKLEGVGRFRVNAYRQRDSVAMVLRRVSDEILDIEELGLPPILRELSMHRRGLVLVTGPTGSGKSTTLASMIRYRKEHSTGHIVTIEDPIEYTHEDAPGCLVSQREIGTDTNSFADALESALRQAPDVLLIGEMRDVASVEAAVYFAETGHLVLSTLHANNAVQTLERVLQFFPDEMHDPIMKQLAMNVRGIVAQRLIPSIDGQRVPAVEVLLGNARMQDLIRDKNLSTIKREIDAFHPEGMQSFDYHLMQLVRAGRITPDEAVRNSDNYNDMRLKLRQYQQEILNSKPDEFC